MYKGRTPQDIIIQFQGGNGAVFPYYEYVLYHKEGYCRRRIRRHHSINEFDIDNLLRICPKCDSLYEIDYPSKMTTFYVESPIPKKNAEKEELCPRCKKAKYRRYIFS